MRERNILPLPEIPEYNVLALLAGAAPTFCDALGALAGALASCRSLSGPLLLPLPCTSRPGPLMKSYTANPLSPSYCRAPWLPHFPTSFRLIAGFFLFAGFTRIRQLPVLPHFYYIFRQKIMSSPQKFLSLSPTLTSTIKKNKKGEAPFLSREYLKCAAWGWVVTPGF